MAESVSVSLTPDSCRLLVRIIEFWTHAHPTHIDTDQAAELSEVFSGKFVSRARTRFEERDERCARWMYDLILKVSPETRIPVWNDWANDIRKLREIDHRSYQDIREMFEFANRHHFWDTNIKSPHKLRKQWSRLVDDKRKESTGQRGQRETIHSVESGGLVL